MDEVVKAFMEDNYLKCGEAFFTEALPGYACYIDEKGDLFVNRPEWDDYKWVDEMWLGFIIRTTCDKKIGYRIWRAF